MKHYTKADLKSLTVAEPEQLAADYKSQMDAVHHINYKHGNTPEFWRAAIKQAGSFSGIDRSQARA